MTNNDEKVRAAAEAMWRAETADLAAAHRRARQAQAWDGQSATTMNKWLTLARVALVAALRSAPAEQVPVADDFMSLAAHLAKVNAGRPVIEGSETGTYVHRDVCIEAMQALLRTFPAPTITPSVEGEYEPFGQSALDVADEGERNYREWLDHRAQPSSPAEGVREALTKAFDAYDRSDIPTHYHSHAPFCDAMYALRRAYELLRHKSSEGADGWIEWEGGECPVGRDAVVEVRFRVEPRNPRYRSRGERAGSLRWDHAGPDSSGDIIAYRLVGGAQ